MVESSKVSSQDSDQYHGKGWRAKKARVPSQTIMMLHTNEAHAADHDEQAIWSATAKPEVAEQDTTSEQSSSTVCAEEFQVASRSDHAASSGIWHSFLSVLTMCKYLSTIYAFALV